MLHTLKTDSELIVSVIGQCPLLLQGKVEAYGSQSELISQGVNPTHLVGLMKKKEERDEFAYEEEDNDEEENEGKGILISRVWLILPFACTVYSRKCLHGANFIFLL